MGVSKGKDIEEGRADNSRASCLYHLYYTDYSGNQIGKAFAENEWFQVEKYIRFFNVTTEEVMARIIATVTLQRGLLDELSSRPDLYGMVPFWEA